MDAQIEKSLKGLHSRHLNGIYAEDTAEARQKILDLISPDAVVGIGDSTGLRQMGLPKALIERGTQVLDAFAPWKEEMHPEEAREKYSKTVAQATVCDVFLTGTNAITQDGRLVSVDAVGNRVAGMVWGHPISIVVAGRNKIVKDLDEAFDRIRNIIAPNHARIRSVELNGHKKKTPCVKTGKCDDCRSIDRICNITMIIEGKPFRTQLSVVLVNEDLGLSWENTWPQSRIRRIIENYKKFVWLPP